MINIFPKNRLFLFWNIGKNVYEKQDCYSNIVEKYSNYYTYLYGNSYLFTRENIHLMKKFYLCFPIFYKKMENITWDQYRLILSFNDKEERYFYYYLSMLFETDYSETEELIENDYYIRI